jgi:transglutaminase-like putative cysteine protease
MTEDTSNRHYRLTHLTTYTYPSAVTSSYGRALLLPRPGSGQQVHISRLTVSPEAAEMREHRDFHGNLSSYFHVTAPHTVLQVRSSSVLTVTRRRVDRDRLPKVPWELAAQAVRTVFSPESRSNGSIAGSLAIAESRLASPMVDLGDDVRDYASLSFAPGRPVPDVVADLCGRIYTDFTYQSGSTTVRTRLSEVLERRTGVCQDFAHLLIACARSMGLAARYVSGYIETRPPAGQEKLRGVDASHAWASVWVPGGGWLHIDPTNDQFIDNRYVILGTGRDYRDVSPLRGIVFTEGSGSTLEVGVDLWPIEADEIEAQVAEVQEGVAAI